MWTMKGPKEPQAGKWPKKLAKKNRVQKLLAARRPCKLWTMKGPKEPQEGKWPKLSRRRKIRPIQVFITKKAGQPEWYWNGGKRSCVEQEIQ